MTPVAARNARLEPVGDDWLMSFPIANPTTTAGHGAGWARVDRVACFFEGQIVDCSDAALAGLAPSADGTDIVAAAYRKYGDAGLAQLRGCFVAAVADSDQRRVIVARDPLGTHPLYYTQSAGSIHFATRPDRLLAMPGTSRALNRAALADHLCFRWPGADDTFFDAVRRVPLGWFVEITPGKVQLFRSWNPLPIGEPINWFQGDAPAAFDEAFTRSVDRCLSFGPSGIFLSGGLDSISVAAVAADQSTRRRLPAPRALSLAFPDPLCDERVTQIGVASSLRIPHQLVAFEDAVGAAGLLPQAAALSHDLSAPAMNSWSPAYLSLARRGSAAGVSTILTGLGGDEWLGVSVLLYADLLAKGDLAGFARLLSTLGRSHNAPLTRLAWQALWTFGLRPIASRGLSRLAPGPWNRRRARRYVRNDPSWIAPDSALRTAQRHRVESYLAPADPSGGFYVQEMRANLEHRLVMWEIEEQYELGALAGVRFAHPYWDPDLISLLVRMPPQVLNRSRRSKGLVRETLAQRFPALGFGTQRKVTATGFLGSILDRECAGLLAELGDFRGLGSLGVVDNEEAQRYCVEALRNHPDARYRVWTLLNTEAWVRTQIDRQ